MYSKIKYRKCSFIKKKQKIDNHWSVSSFLCSRFSRRFSWSSVLSAVPRTCDSDDSEIVSSLVWLEPASWDSGFESTLNSELVADSGGSIFFELRGARVLRFFPGFGSCVFTCRLKWQPRMNWASQMSQVNLKITYFSHGVPIIYEVLVVLGERSKSSPENISI